MNEASLTSALNLLGEFLADGRSAPVWLVVGGGSALLAQHLLGTTSHPKLHPLLQELGHDDLIPAFS